MPTLREGLSDLRDFFKYSRYRASADINSAKARVQTARANLGQKAVDKMADGATRADARMQVVNEELSNLLSNLGGNPDDSPPNSGPARSSARPVTSYEGAPLASAYGMDSATAYQEALANSAHQREVSDLLAAGLNPVLSVGRGSGADSFAGTPAVVPSGSSHSASRSKADLISAGGDIASAILTFSGNGKYANAAKTLARGISRLADD